MDLKASDPYVFKLGYYRHVVANRMNTLLIPCKTYVLYRDTAKNSQSYIVSIFEAPAV